jgi:hypothetical protein
MIGNALLLALVLYMAFCFLLMDRLKFLIPYRQPIFHNYGWAIALCAVLLFGNLFASLFLLARENLRDPLVGSPNQQPHDE